MPYDNSTQKKYGENPLQKRSGFKMKGYSYPGVSPMKSDTKKDPDYIDTGEREGGATFGKIDFTQDKRIVNLKKAGAPTSVVNKKLKEIEEQFRADNALT